MTIWWIKVSWKRRTLYLNQYHMKTSFLIFSAIAFAACSNPATSADNTESTQTAGDTSMHADHQMASDDLLKVSDGQQVYFPNLADGQEISLPFVIEFGVKGMEVEPAQMAVAGKGHHHLLIDKEAVPAGEMVPMGSEDKGYYHFGKGQLKDTLTISKYPMLTKGTHKLRLQFANGMHQSYGPAMSKEVIVIVK